MDVVLSKCAGLDVHQRTVVACARVVAGSSVKHDVRTFGTTTAELLALSDWLSTYGCTQALWARSSANWLRRRPTM